MHRLKSFFFLFNCLLLAALTASASDTTKVNKPSSATADAVITLPAGFSSLKVTGELVPSLGKGQKVELKASLIEILANAYRNTTDEREKEMSNGTG